MTRYECPTPNKEHTMMWDQNMRPWSREGHMWKRVKNTPGSDLHTWESLFRENSPLETDQREAAQNRFQLGETYAIRFAETEGIPANDIPRAICAGDAKVREGVYTLDDPVQFILVPPNESNVNLPHIKGISLRDGSICILDVEELVAVPKEILRGLIAGGEANVSAATQWYKYAYGRNIGA